MAGLGARGVVPNLVRHRSKSRVLVWDLPLRIWHWLFAIAVLTALATGLIEPFQYIEVHQWAGISIVCLLVFRITWGLWGSVYARWSKYWTSPRAFVNHFFGKGTATPHTAPGIVLVVVLMLAALTQAVTGLFMTDDIFFDGPLYPYISSDIADIVDDIHENMWRVVIAAIGIHLIAHFVYGVVLRDSTSLSMITGYKRVALPPTNNRWPQAYISVVLAVVMFAVLARLAT